MFRFVEYHYTNALYLYKRIDGYGERISASAASIFFSLGVCMLGINVIQQFTDVLAAIARRLVPAAKNDDAALYAVAAAFSLVLNYYWLGKRTPLLEKRYASLEAHHQRWLAPVGFLFSCAFALACGYGRVNFLGSLLIATSILVVQELLYGIIKTK